MREEISGDSIYSSLEGEFEAIEKDYQLMRDYMLRGYKDPQIESVYRSLLRRACRLYGSMCLAEMVKRRPSYISAGISSGLMGVFTMSMSVSLVFRSFSCVATQVTRWRTKVLGTPALTPYIDMWSPL